LVKLKPLPSPGKQTPFFRNINLGILTLHVLIILIVFIDSKLYRHSHVDYIFSQAIKLLGFIRNITFSFSTLDSLLTLHFSLVRPKLGYASVVWYAITSIDVKKLESIQRKFVALSYNRFLSTDSNGYSYANVLQVLNLLQVLYMVEDIILMHFLSLMCFCALNLVHLPWTLLVFEFALGTSESFLCFMLVHFPKTVPPPGVPLQQSPFAINWISSEGKWLHLVRCDIILF
jgi:hypothetical protein